VLSDDSTQAVFICSRHSQHANQVLQAVEADKSVFVEKPLAVNQSQLADLEEAFINRPARVLVGFNRRFSPMLRMVKTHLAGAGPLSVHYRCNAGPAPAGHWLADPNEGGRIVGEGCHFFDVFAFLTESRPVSVFAALVGGDDADQLQISVTYSDGSVCQLSYVADGARYTSKERLEVFGGGKSALLDDYRSVELHQGTKRVSKKRSFGQDKGHRQELIEFIAAVKSGGGMPIPLESLLSTTRVSLAAVESARNRSIVDL
jgi:predicted dehydrogenase